MKRNNLFALIMATLVLFSACGGDAVPPKDEVEVEQPGDPIDNPNPGAPQVPQPIEIDLEETDGGAASGGLQPGREAAPQVDARQPITGGLPVSVTFSGEFGGESIINSYTEEEDLRRIVNLMEIHPLGSEDNIFVAEDAIVINMRVQDSPNSSYAWQVMQATDTSRSEEVTLIRGDGTSFVAEQSVYEALLELWAGIVICR